MSRVDDDLPADLLGAAVEVRTRQYPAWARSWFSESQLSRLGPTRVWIRSVSRVELLDRRAVAVARVMEDKLSAAKGQPSQIQGGLREIARETRGGLTHTVEGQAWLRALGFIRRHGSTKRPQFTLQLPVADPDECVCGACPTPGPALWRLLSKPSHPCGKPPSDAPRNVLDTGTFDPCGQLRNVLDRGTLMFSRGEHLCSRQGNINVLAWRTCNVVSSSIALDHAGAAAANTAGAPPSVEKADELLAAMDPDERRQLREAIERQTFGQIRPADSPPTRGVLAVMRDTVLGRLPEPARRAPVQPWLNQVVDGDQADTA